MIVKLLLIILHLAVIVVINCFVLISNILKSSLHCPGYRIEKVPITINVLLTIGLRMKVWTRFDRISTREDRVL